MGEARALARSSTVALARRCRTRRGGGARLRGVAQGVRDDGGNLGCAVLVFNVGVFVADVAEDHEIASGAGLGCATVSVRYKVCGDSIGSGALMQAHLCPSLSSGHESIKSGSLTGTAVIVMLRGWISKRR
jgi:hypothetical protein